MIFAGSIVETGTSVTPPIRSVPPRGVSSVFVACLSSPWQAATSAASTTAATPARTHTPSGIRRFQQSVKPLRAACHRQCSARARRHRPPAPLTEIVNAKRGLFLRRGPERVPPRLIFVGVVGQIFDATHREELDFGLWWYVVLLGVFILAAAAWRGLIVWRQRQVVAHRLRARPHAWATTVDDYEQERRDVGQVRGDVLAKGLGRKWYARLVDEVEQTAADQKQAGAQPQAPLPSSSSGVDSG